MPNYGAIMEHLNIKKTRINMNPYEKLLLVQTNRAKAIIAFSLWSSNGCFSFLML